MVKEVSSINENKLVEQALQRNEAAVELLIPQHYNDVYRFVRWKVHDGDLAWDLSQSTWETGSLRMCHPEIQIA